MHAHFKTSEKIKKCEFYEIEAETFYFLVFSWFHDKIGITSKTSDICISETVPYISVPSDGTRAVKWNIKGDYSDYLFINVTSDYREELL